MPSTNRRKTRSTKRSTKRSIRRSIRRSPKKHYERKSPNQHAADTKAGTIMKGNDGNQWIVKKVLGSKRWFKLV